MIKKFAVGNYRVFKELSDEIEFSKITILTGANSSGKSSISKALLLLKENTKKNIKLDRIEFSDDESNLGGIDFIRNNIKNDICFHVVTAPNINLRIGGLYLPKEFYFNTFYDKTNNTTTGFLNKFYCDIYDEKGKKHLLFSFYASKEGKDTTLFFNLSFILNQIKNQYKKIPLEKRKLDELSLGLSGYSLINKNDDFYLNGENILNYNKLDEIFSEEKKNESKDLKIFYKILNQSLLDFFTSCSIPKTIVQNPFLYWGFIKPFENESKGDHKDLLSLYFEKDLTDESYILENYIGLMANFETEAINLDKHNFEGLEYKDYIKKISSFNIKDITNPIFFDFFKEIIIPYFITMFRSYIDDFRFEYLEAVRNASTRIFNSDNKWPFNKIIDEYYNLPSNYTEDAVSHKQDFLRKWLRIFEIGDDIIIENVGGIAKRVFITKNKKRTELCDLGYGVNQLLPMLLKVIFSNKMTYDPIYTNLIIEEPEANLHPKFQSILADFFIDVVENFEVRLIIETHSEYLIRKLQYLTGKKQVKPEDSIIYYFHDPQNIPKGEKQIKEIRINEDGSLSDDFGPGFFDEATNWKFELLKLKNLSN